MAQLKQIAIEKMLLDISKITVEDIVDPKADEPRCTDTPYLQWKVFKNNVELPIKVTGQCHVSEFPNYPNKRYAYIITEVLNGMAALVSRY